MLRASTDESKDASPRHASELEAFATAVATGDEALRERRDDLLNAIGAERFVEAAAVTAAFHGYVRVADGTGIPVDEMVVATSGQLREEMGINSYAGSSNSRLEVAERPAAEFNPRLVD